MKRIFLDICLLLVLVALLCFGFLPERAHEVLGTAAFVLVLVHLYLNRGYLTSLGRGRWTAARSVRLALNALLLLAFAGALVTGVLSSQALYRAFVPLALRRSMVVQELHTALPYAVLVLAGLHLGWHFASWRARLATYLPRLAGGAAAKAIAALVALAGLYGAHANELWGRLTLGHFFETAAMAHGGAVYAGLVLATAGLFVVVGYYAARLLGRRAG